MQKSNRNKTITLEESERATLKTQIIQSIAHNIALDTIKNRIIAGDIFAIAQYLPAQFSR